MDVHSLLHLRRVLLLGFFVRGGHLWSRGGYFISSRDVYGLQRYRRKLLSSWIDVKCRSAMSGRVLLSWRDERQAGVRCRNLRFRICERVRTVSCWYLHLLYDRLFQLHPYASLHLYLSSSISLITGLLPHDHLSRGASTAACAKQAHASYSLRTRPRSISVLPFMSVAPACTSLASYRW